ncbi:hypothetical protein MKW92_001757 [Papaver armeniacum]|nr:hypothetical protein MKW92_001757 [Papaver armeniacum]
MEFSVKFIFLIGWIVAMKNGLSGNSLLNLVHILCRFDLLVTGGRDSVCRVWDIRTKMQVFALSGHHNTVCSVFARSMDPQVVTGSHDTTIKFWDLRYGRTTATLTQNNKSVRAMVHHPTERSFVSASGDSIKRFGLPRGYLWFWDWKSGHNFQQSQTIAQPDSLDSEAGIYALSYDTTGSRLVTCEADKTIKMWKQDENASPQSHPRHYTPKDLRSCF